MFGRDIYTPKPDILFEPRPLITISINQVLPPTSTIIPEKGRKRPTANHISGGQTKKTSLLSKTSPYYINTCMAKTLSTTPFLRVQTQFGTTSTQRVTKAEVSVSRHRKLGEETKREVSYCEVVNHDFKPQGSRSHGMATRK